MYCTFLGDRLCLAFLLSAPVCFVTGILGSLSERTMTSSSSQPRAMSNLSSWPVRAFSSLSPRSICSSSFWSGSLLSGLANSYRLLVIFKFFGFVLPYKETLLTFCSFCSDSGMFSEGWAINFEVVFKLEPVRDDFCLALTYDTRPELSLEFLLMLSFSRLNFSANLCFCLWDGFLPDLCLVSYESLRLLWAAMAV